jgi:hypothetical protein
MILLVASLLIMNSCSPAKERNYSRGQGPVVSPRKAPNTEEDDIGVEGKDYRAGEVLVKFKNHVPDKRKEDLTNLLELEVIRIVSTANVYLLKIRGPVSVKDVIERLETFDEVEYAEPNTIRTAY